MLKNEFLSFPTFNNLETIEENGILMESVDPRSVFNVRLSSSEIFQIAEAGNKIGGEKMSIVLSKAVTSKDGFTHLSLESFEHDTYQNLFESYRTKYDARNTVIDMIKRGDIVLCYSEKYKTPTAIPFIVKSSLPATVYVFVSDFLKMDQYGKVKISDPRNYTVISSLLISAAYAQVTMQHKITTMPSVVTDSMVLMYGKMFEKSMNGLVNLDTAMKAKVRYIGVQFCLIQMYGTIAGQSLCHRIGATYFKDLGDNILKHIDDNIKVDAYDDIKTLLENMGEIYPQFKTLAFKDLMEKWIRSYGSCAVMTMDYPGFLIYMFVSLVMDSPLINRIMMEQCVNVSLADQAFKSIQQSIQNS